VDVHGVGIDPHLLGHAEPSRLDVRRIFPGRVNYGSSLDFDAPDRTANCNVCSEAHGGSGLAAAGLGRHRIAKASLKDPVDDVVGRHEIANELTR